MNWMLRALLGSPVSVAKRRLAKALPPGWELVTLRPHSRWKRALLVQHNGGGFFRFLSEAPHELDDLCTIDAWIHDDLVRRVAAKAEEA